MSENYNKEIKDLIDRFKAKFSFPLDTFQIKAINSLLQNKSVLVSAPTGSGKTIVAEFAVFEALDRNLRIIYTTPLKALSNQKFRDLRESYGESVVGLSTGDISINPNASIVVMTTEILRNILYQDPRRLDDVLYVVIDECHYMNDEDRGTAWEELIIHCLPHIQLVALSATVANAKELASWISLIHREIDVIEHLERPVPLRYFYYTNKKLLNYFDKNGNLNKKLLRILHKNHIIIKKHAVSSPIKLIEKLKSENMLPAIYFIFSRKGCNNALIECFNSSLDLTDKNEKKQIRERINEFLKNTPSILQTSEITNILIDSLPLGLGLHHAGLVPSIKYLVEILFQKGLIKVVFATETLAAGINMPARTTIISNLSKKGEYGHRDLTVSEFSQMTGRAGRRGIDTIGNCIVLDDGYSSLKQSMDLIKGFPEPIESHFTFSYNMVLNLLKNYHLNQIKPILKRSFKQYQSNKEIININEDLKTQQKYLNNIILEKNFKCEKSSSSEITGNMFNYLELKNKLEKLQNTLKSEYIFKQLNNTKIGTILIIKIPQYKNSIVGVLINKKFSSTKKNLKIWVYTNNGIIITDSIYCIYISKKYRNLNLSPDLIKKLKKIKKNKFINDKSYPNLFSNEEIQEIHEEMISFNKSQFEMIDNIKSQIKNHICETCDKKEKHLKSYKSIIWLNNRIEKLKQEIEIRQEIFWEQFLKFTNVLKYFDFLIEDKEDLKPTIKGEITCHIRAQNDLLISLVVLSGILDELTPSEIATSLVCLTHESRKRENYFDDLHYHYFSKKCGKTISKIREIAEEIEFIQKKEKVDYPLVIDLEMVPLIYLWANNYSWKDIISKNNLNDGDIIRSIRQLIDLLHQLSNLPAISNELQRKFKEAIDLLDRDLVKIEI